MIKRLFFPFTFLFFSVVLYPQTNFEYYNGIVNDNSVRIRNRPSLEGGIIGRLDQRMSVTVLGRSQDRMFLEGYDSYWLKIKKDNVEGWTYGAYINLTNSRYDTLPIVSYNKFNVKVDLNYSRDLPDDDLKQKEKEAIKLQSDRFYSCSIQEFYDSIVNEFRQQKSLRPFFLNTSMIGYTERDVFFYLSSSTLCEYIQASYSDNISISPLNIHDKNSATFMISGFKKISGFSGPRITAIAINIKKIESNSFAPLNGKTVVDFVILTPNTAELDFGGDSDKFYNFLTSSSSIQIYLRYSPILRMILE
jgi:hypothetical protein